MGGANSRKYGDTYSKTWWNATKELYATHALCAANRFSKGVYEDLSREMGIPFTKARETYLAVGRIIQKRLLLSKACGIPYVCTLYVRHALGRVYVIPPNPFRGKSPLKADYRKRPKASLKVWWPRELMRAITLESPYGKSVKEQYYATLKKSKRRTT